MRFLAIIFFLIILPAIVFADTTYVSDTVSGVWDSTGSPYILTGDCIIPTGDTLFIRSGTSIITIDTTERFLTGHELHYHSDAGYLFIEGSPDFVAYFKRVSLRYPTAINYALIESTSVGVYNSLSMHIENTEIRYCNIGIHNYRYTNSFIYGNSLSIHHCFYGVYGSGALLYRSLFHHNDYGYFTAFYSVQEFNYCTFENNEIAYIGIYIDGICLRSEGIFKNCLIGDRMDRNGGSIWSSNSYCGIFPGGTYTDYPCYVDTAFDDYNLDSLSPYIDKGDISLPLPPDPLFGYGPDLGALESRYGGARFIPYLPTSPVIAPFTGLHKENDFSIYFENIGSLTPDSVLFFIDTPYYLSGTSDSSFHPRDSIEVFIHFEPVHCLDLSETLFIKWWADDTNSIEKLVLDAMYCLDYALAETTYSFCPVVYLLDSAYVPDTSIWVIESGARIVIRKRDSLPVYGRIEALGDSLNKINWDSDVPPPRPRFCTLNFLPGSSCEFNWCDMRNVPISSDNSNLSFSNSTFWHSGDPIRNFQCSNTIAIFDNCLIKRYGDANGAIGDITSGSDFEFNDCEFFVNTVLRTDWLWGKSGMMRIYDSDVRLNRCLFKDNIVDYHPSSGGYIGHHCGAEAFLAINSNVTATNCIFDNDDPGGTGGIVNLINCTFNDVDSMAVYSGNYFNCIFPETKIYWTRNLKNCIVAPGVDVDDTAEVIFGTPTFASDSTYELLPTSIGVDMGAEFAVTDSGDTIWAPTTDFYGNPRPSGTAFDIGAHEYQWEDYELSIHGEIGWNLVSSPTVGTHFMTEILEHYESPLFLYDTEDGVYNYWTLLLPGTGYWVLISDTFTNVIADSVLDSVSVELYRGWNLIGTIGRPVPASVITDSSFVIPPVYGYDAASGGYFESSVLLPGRGYWVLTSSNGSVLIRE
ncbi:hypothetical protein DRQ36_08300 [bacterium]|nr:MAG: hypothetical protein DRQ36_08300 [bacterium]